MGKSIQCNRCGSVNVDITLKVYDDDDWGIWMRFERF